MEIARELLQSQKGVLFKAIEQRDLRPNYFSWKNFDSERGKNFQAEGMSYKDTGYYFIFDCTWEETATPSLTDIVLCSPGEEKKAAGYKTPNWLTTLQIFKNWLVWLQRETETPDYWGNLAVRAEEMAGVVETEIVGDSNFSANEKKQLIATLNRIELRIKENTELTEEQIAFVEREILYLKEISNRLTKKDWLLLAIGGIINMATVLRLDAPTVHEVFQYLKEGLSGAIKLLGS